MEVEVAEVRAPEGQKVARSLPRMCHDNLISHGIKEGQSLVIVCVEHVVCTCNG